MSLADLTRPAVESAISEFDRLGQNTFLAKHGFAEAKRYWLVSNGKRYPSKAIAGVAHGYLPGQKKLASNTFTGGVGSVVKKLSSLGFHIEKPARNPPWNRDELILALELYMSNPASPPGKDSPEVGELSALLNKLHRIAGTSATPTLRNSNGVYLKMMNLRSLDPAYTAQGKVGMKAGGKLEKEIFGQYSNDTDGLRADAAEIRDVVATASEEQIDEPPSTTGYVGEEGGVVMRLHRRYERDPKLVRAKRAEAIAKGQLECEVCGFNFEQAYGELGRGYIEIHHLNPVSQLGKKGKTDLNDLALLCANCHRMAHRKRKPLGITEIRKFLERAIS